MISVIIPMYNASEYILSCVSSVIEQTIKDFEIILVDDGSTDNSLELVRQINDSRLHVFLKANGGPSDSRNYGLSVAKGEYITFVDSDDIVSENYLEYLLIGAKKGDASISITSFSRNRVMKKPVYKETRFFSRDQALKQLFCDNLYGMSLWGKLFKKELFDGLKFPVGKYYEDMFVMDIVFNKAGKIAFSPVETYFYRKANGSIMQTTISSKKIEDLRIYNKQILSNYFGTSLMKYTIIRVVINDLIMFRHAGNQNSEYFKNEIAFVRRNALKVLFNRTKMVIKIATFIAGLNWKLIRERNK